MDVFGGERGFTIGGFNGQQGVDLYPGKLVVGFLDRADLASAREMNDPKRYESFDRKYRENWNATSFAINPPPGMSYTEFIREILDTVRKYEEKGGKVPEYDKEGPNCNSFAFSVLVHSGCPRASLSDASDLDGWDWGEAELVPGSYFK